MGGSALLGIYILAPSPLHPRASRIPRHGSSVCPGSGYRAEELNTTCDLGKVQFHRAGKHPRHEVS
jgi:hypothetical protein